MKSILRKKVRRGAEGCMYRKKILTKPMTFIIAVAFSVLSVIAPINAVAIASITAHTDISIEEMDGYAHREMRHDQFLVYEEEETEQEQQPIEQEEETEEQEEESEEQEEESEEEESEEQLLEEEEIEEEEEIIELTYLGSLTVNAKVYNVEQLRAALGDAPIDGSNWVIEIISQSDFIIDNGSVIIPSGVNVTLVSGVNSVLTVNDNIRHFLLNANSSLTIGVNGEGNSGVTLEGRLMGQPGGGILVNHPGARLVLYDGIIQRNIADHNTDRNSDPSIGGGGYLGNLNRGGGGVAIRSGNFEMRGGTISNNTARPAGYSPTPDGHEGGGGVYVDSDGVFEMHGGTVRHNEAFQGGGVFVNINNNGSVISFRMFGGDISENTATGVYPTQHGGGGVLVVGSRFDMHGGSIHGNRALAGGGGGVELRHFAASEVGSVPIEALFNMHAPSSIAHNEAHLQGGGIWGGVATNITMYGGTITDNKVTISTQIQGVGLGGGIFVQGLFENLSGSIEIARNSAQGGGGIALFGSNARAYVRNNTEIHNNEAQNGGGIYMFGVMRGVDGAIGEFIASGSVTIRDNTANSDGGGVYIFGSTGSGVFTASDSVGIMGNTAQNNGGGVYIFGPPVAGPPDAGVFTATGNVIISGNEAQNGGGIWSNVYNRVVTGENVRFRGNRAIAGSHNFGAWNRGVPHNLNAAEHGGSGNPENINWREVSILNTHALNNYDVFYIGGAATDWERLRIAIETFDAETITIYPKGTITPEENIAEGVLIITDPLEGNYDFINTTNRAINVRRDVSLIGYGDIMLNTYDAAHGRHFHILESVEVSFENIIMDGRSYAGGLFVAYEAVAILDGLVIQNARSANEGGGIRSEGSLTVKNALITDSMGTNGGGIWAQGALTVKDSEIIENTALAVGGGIRAQGALIIEDSEIRENKAINGGGIWAQGSLTVKGSEITENIASAAGGGIRAQGVLIIEDSEIRKNEATNGGGIFAEREAVISEGSVIAENTADEDGGGIRAQGALTIEDSEIRKNEATNGGGIFAEREVVISEGSVIAENTADEDGGGMYIDLLAEATISNSEFRNNEAQYGGGIFAGRGELIIKQGTVIAGNIAEYDGGGIFTFNHMGLQIESGVTFSENEAARIFFIEMDSPDFEYIPRGLNEFSITAGVLRALYTGAHDYQIVATVMTESWGSNLPFTYLHNNLDVNYVGTAPSREPITLPETGGSGTRTFTLTGLLLMALATTAFVRTRKRSVENIYISL